MSRTHFSRLVASALALIVALALAAVDSHGGGKGDKGNGDKGKGDEKKSEGKKVGQEQIVHGCISAVTLAAGTTPGTVTFVHPKWGGTVKVIETGTTKTVIEVCGETKTLTELKKLVEGVAPGKARFCGIARIDDRTSLKASKILVCNDGAD
jgi:hypothetical protein